MALLIDQPAWPAHGRRWSHLVSDVGLEELHSFVAALGIPRRAFEGDHYDIPEERYAQVVAAGARPASRREILAALSDTGVRMPKRKGDRGLVRVRDVSLANGARVDVDLFLSGKPFDERRVFAAMVFVRDAGGDLAAVHSTRRAQWGCPGGWREPGESVRHNAIREVGEEVGLHLVEEDLTLWGYERFTHRSGPWWLPPGRDVLQTYVTNLSAVRPPLAATDEGTSDRRWVTPEEFARLCRAEFWWPLAARLLE